MRRAANIDANQPEITAGLRDVGATVQPLHMVGKGMPDLLVGYRSANFLLEIKNPKQFPSDRRLTDDEVEWHANWRGHVAVVETLDDALRAIGAIE